MSEKLVSEKKLLNFIKKYHAQEIMVIGDMIADVYLEGKISRISREAPVLVLEYDQEHLVLGGAANVVHNAAALGAKVHAAGVIGNDSYGKEMRRLFQEKNILTAGLMADSSSDTIAKTRVMAGGQATVRQQIVRIDRASKLNIAAHTEKKIASYIKKEIDKMSAVILSDYGSGTISETIGQLVISTCREKKIPCLVDSRYNILSFQGATVIKQNETEAAQATGYEYLNRENLLSVGKSLLEKMRTEVLLITRGADGMSVFESNGKTTHIPVANAREVYDVSGAGDTAIVVMALSLASGANAAEAAYLSNIAAGEVVKKFGTAVTSINEIKMAVKSLV